MRRPSLNQNLNQPDTSMKTTLKRVFLTGAFIAASTAPLIAANITYVGVAANDDAGPYANQVVNWRTVAQAKSLDLDLNGVYGSFGSAVWGDGVVNSKLTDQGTGLFTGQNGAGVVGWSLVNQTVNPDLGIGLQNFQHAAYVQIDNPTAPGLITPGLASISPGNGTVTIQLEGDTTNYVGRTLRLGVMWDYQEPGAVNDVSKQFDVAQTSGAGSGFATVTTPDTRTRQPKLYFFDITSITNGDQFTITGYMNPATTGSGGLASIGTITMDLSLPPGSFPQIVTQPIGSTNSAGDNYTFVAGVTGAAPLTNLWTRNGNPIAGATNSSFPLLNVTTADSGTYRFIARNQYGSVTSAPAILLVNYQPPGFGSQPAGGHRTVGDTFTLTASASGSPVLTYQWIKDGVPVAGATNASLVFTTLALADSGTYNLVANNTGNSVTSSPAILTVEPVHPIYANLRHDYSLNGTGATALFTNANGVWAVMNDEDFNPLNASAGGLLTVKTGQGGSGIEAYGGTEFLNNGSDIPIGEFPMIGDSQLFNAGAVPRSDAVALHPGLSTTWGGGWVAMTSPRLLVKFTAATTLANLGIGYRIHVVNGNGANDGVVYSLANNAGAVLATNLVAPGAKSSVIAAANPIGTLAAGQSVYLTIGDNQNLSGDETFLTLTLENLAEAIVPPTVSAGLSGDQLTLTWPSSYYQYTLEGAVSLTSPVWTVVPGQAGTSATVTASGPEQYFRLRYNHY